MDARARTPRRSRLAAAGLVALTALACAGAGGPAPASVPTPTAPPAASAGANAARVALSLIGTPYRSRGVSPAGFDCSGLVVYSYAEAGVDGLPHSAARLEHLTRPVPLDELTPGDLLFFQLAGKKTSHVAIYVGERAFVHAPSSGKRVERVSFDHVYWAPRLARAGRLEP